ncbi:MAG: AMP-binding protein, partial [Pseudomonadota bacterium]
MDLIEFVRQKAKTFGDKTYLIGEGGPVSYAELDANTNRLAAQLIALGVQPCDRVALLHPNSPYLFQGYLAVAKAAAVAVPVNPIYTPPEIGHILADSGAKLLVAHESLADKAAEPVAQLARPPRIVVRREDQSLTQALGEAGGGDGH